MKNLKLLGTGKQIFGEIKKNLSVLKILKVGVPWKDLKRFFTILKIEIHTCRLFFNNCGIKIFIGPGKSLLKFLKLYSQKEKAEEKGKFSNTKSEKGPPIKWFFSKNKKFHMKNNSYSMGKIIFH